MATGEDHTRFGTGVKDFPGYRISIPENTTNVGGCNIFGKSFGNYNQDIMVSLLYETKTPNTKGSVKK